MAEQFKLQTAELQKVCNGLRDVESQMTSTMSTLRAQLAAEGTPWQFSAGPAGVEANLDNTQRSVDPSTTGRLNGLADYLQEIINIFEESDR